MTTKSHLQDRAPGVVPTSTADEARLRNMQASKEREALDKSAAEAHPLKGDVDRAGFDLGGIDGKPIDAGLRDVATPLDE